MRDRSQLTLILSALVLSGFGVGWTGSVHAAQRPVTFNRDVAPILYANCVSCHRAGEAAPFPLVDYQDAKQRASLIATATARHYMPPWQPDAEAGEFKGDRRLTDHDIDLIQQWVTEGAVEGEKQDLPPLPNLSGKWRLGTPDLIVEMPEAFEVPADGRDVFRNFVLPVPMERARFVRALEFRPVNPKVVHHVRILLDDTGDIRWLDAKDDGPGFGGMDVAGPRFPDGHFLGWAPGKMVGIEDHPWPLEPGTDFMVQMHLKPAGRPETVRSEIGLYFTDDPPAQIPLMVRLGSEVIDIPPGTPRHEVVDSFVLPVDVRVLSVYPHAHYLGKEMTVTARRPTGGVQTLLHIPDWNFNWQDEYHYRRPIDLPKGTAITMRYAYDNTDANPHNPSRPARRVRFGSKTTDEMGDLLLQVLAKSPVDRDKLQREVSRKSLVTDIAGKEKRVRDEPGDYETRNALAVSYARVGRGPAAVRQLTEVLRLSPEHALALYNLATLAMTDGRYDEALGYLQRALKTRPDYSEAHNNLGVLLERVGRSDEAFEHFRLALMARPTSPDAHNNMGRALLRRGLTDGAIASFKAALRTRSDHPEALLNLGRTYAVQGDRAAAVAEWRKAIEVYPDMIPALVDLAFVLATDAALRRPREAVTLAERATRLPGGSNNALALDVLAAAYAADGRQDLAHETALRAYRAALSEKNDALADRIRRRLQTFQAGAQNGGRSPEFP